MCILFSSVLLLPFVLRGFFRHDQALLDHLVFVGVFCIMMLNGVSVIVAIRSSPLFVGTHLISVNKHVVKERSPHMCRRRRCHDCNTDVAVCRSTCVVVLFSKLHIIVLSSMYPIMCWINLIKFVTSVNWNPGENIVIAPRSGSM